MRYDSALRLVGEIKEVCPDPVISPLSEESTKQPRPDLETTIACVVKVTQNRPFFGDLCAVLNSSDCPNDIDQEVLGRLRERI